jgi:hypothetical protein
MLRPSILRLQQRRSSTSVEGLFVEPALKISFSDGSRDLVLHYASHSIKGNELTVTLRDISRDLFVDLHYHVDDDIHIKWWIQSIRFCLQPQDRQEPRICCFLPGLLQRWDRRSIAFAGTILSYPTFCHRRRTLNPSRDLQLVGSDGICCQ